jgi:tetratricopeptide (TPR) repeat protein
MISISSQLSSELAQKLIEIGFIASNRGYFKEAEAIFNGLISARPMSEYPLIGLAFNHMNSGNTVLGMKILADQALKLNPDSQMAQLYLGLAMRLSNLNSYAEDILSQVVENGKDPQAVNAAQLLLADIRRTHV